MNESLCNSPSTFLRANSESAVNWQTWSATNLRDANENSKPIFLFIGNSVAHWTNMMTDESFKDSEVVELLNTYFTCFMVDRELRPDLDFVFTNAVQSMTGKSGWPLTVFLTPEFKPFFGGSYFPPKDYQNLPSLKTVLANIVNIWTEKSAEVMASGEKVFAAMAQRLNLLATAEEAVNVAPKVDEDGDEIEEEQNLYAQIFHQAFKDLDAAYDKENAGFSVAPKFPQPASIMFLLRYFKDNDYEPALHLAISTLNKMASGGIFDQLGGGFHRYSTDSEWHVPNFEKMVGENAFLLQAYIEAFQLTESPIYEKVIAESLCYLLDYMQEEDGAFYTAQSATSVENVEGELYLWSLEEVKTHLGEELANTFCGYYGVDEEGQFDGGKCVLLAPDDHEAHCAEMKQDHKVVTQQLIEAKQILWNERLLRIQLPVDKSIISAVNGLIIDTLAKAHQVFEEPRYLKAAKEAATFVLDNLLCNGEAPVRALNGELSGVPVFLDDLSNMALALVGLYEAEFETEWIRKATRLTDLMIEKFWDDKEKTFFYNSAEHDDALIKYVPFFDSEMPSGISTALMVLLKLNVVVDNDRYREICEAMIGKMTPMLRQAPRAAVHTVSALYYFQHRPLELVVTGDLDAAETKELLRAIHYNFSPNKVVVGEPRTGISAEDKKLIPLLKYDKREEGKPTAYFCDHYYCDQPITDPETVNYIMGIHYDV